MVKIMLISLLVILCPLTAFGRPEYVKKTGNPCIYCHFNPAGGVQLNKVGTSFKNNGLRLPKSNVAVSTNGTGNRQDPFKSSSEKLTFNKGSSRKKAGYSKMSLLEKRALNRERAAALKKYTKIVKRGHYLFHEPGILGSGIRSCGDCHKSKDLSDTISSYPKWNKELSDVITFDRKLRYCIFKKVKGKPLSPESLETVALNTYLKEVKKGTIR